VSNLGLERRATRYEVSDLRLTPGKTGPTLGALLPSLTAEPSGVRSALQVSIKEVEIRVDGKQTSDLVVETPEGLWSFA
jgi:hypothetical protein